MTAERLARAVLYEGFTLYPYRASALKNRRRVLFGTLFPPAWANAKEAGDPSTAMVECLVTGASPEIRATLRFVRLDGSNEVREEIVEVGEGITSFDRGGVLGAIEIGARALRAGIFSVQARVSCTGSCAVTASRDEAEAFALGAAHVVLRARGGKWISLLDPPPGLVNDAAACKREGLYAIVVGDEILASPIALDDRPRIAPESGRDFYDATEIEEMLCLRVATLSDAEKEEIRAAGGVSRDVLDWVDALTPDEMMRMHGAKRTEDDPRALGIGARVRIRPGSVRADALDVVLAGMDATVVSIEETVEGERLACVTIDADPGKDLGEGGFPGHRFFFRESELERQP